LPKLLKKDSEVDEQIQGLIEQQKKMISMMIKKERAKQSELEYLLDLNI